VTRLTFSPRAERDLAEIGDYVARDNPVAARDLIRSLRARCAVLKTIPLSGRQRLDLGDEIRSFPLGAYTIYYSYREAEDRAHVVRIWHSSRRYPGPRDLL
jgi:toxin ParE1/3/4